MDRCSPLVKRKNTASKKVTSEMTLNTSACRMNGMSRRIRKNSMSDPCSSSQGSGFGARGHGRGRIVGLGLPDLADGHALQFLLAAVPQVHEATREQHGGEHRREDAQAVHD